MTHGAHHRLEQELGHRFADPGWLRRALAHRSYCAEHPGEVSNERLEFLGDAVLGLVVADRVYRDYPELPEGELAKVRAHVVSTDVLAEVATGLGIGSHVLLGRGEEQSGGRTKTSILADTLEALIGAVYLDGGYDAVAGIVVDLFGGQVADAAKGPGIHDYKTRLQELAVQVLDEVPRYQVSDEGPDHAKQFEAQVSLRGAARGFGRGTSKKQAEQDAAAEAWEWLRALAPSGGGDVGDGPGDRLGASGARGEGTDA